MIVSMAPMSIASMAKPIVEVMREGFIALLKLAREATINLLAHCPVFGRIRSRVKWKLSRRIEPIRRWILDYCWKLALKTIGYLAPMVAQNYPTPPQFAKAYGRFQVVGLRHYSGVARLGENVSLIRNPSNRFDSNAIAVYNCRDVQVGFISKDGAVILARVMDAGRNVYGKVLGEADQYRLQIEVLEK